MKKEKSRGQKQNGVHPKERTSLLGTTVYALQL
jgi:hypothetical protein